MSDYNNKTEDPEQASSRFEHKSQGMRTAIRSEKRAAEEAAEKEILEALDEDKTIKIEKTSKKEAVSKTASSDVSAEKSTSKETAEKSAVSSKVSKVFEEEEEPAAVSDGLGITVFVNKSDIPAYEIGLNTEDFYIPREIKEGKVSKISEEQIEEFEANAAKRRKRQQLDSTGNKAKKTGKKKKTPAQKALKALIWVAVWFVVFLIAFFCYRITYDVFYDIAVDPDSTSTFEYTVEAGATDESVYEDLCELGVMNSSEFIYKLRAIVFEAEYVEGTYTLSDGYNMEKIINILAGYNYSDDDD